MPRLIPRSRDRKSPRARELMLQAEAVALHASRLDVEIGARDRRSAHGRLARATRTREQRIHQVDRLNNRGVHRAVIRTILACENTVVGDTVTSSQRGLTIAE